MPMSLGVASPLSLAILVWLSCGIWSPTPVQAQASLPAWRPYEVPAHADPVGAAHLVYVGSLARIGTLRQAWTVVQLVRPVKLETDEVHGWLTFVEVDCTARGERRLREIGYGYDGHHLYHARSAPPLEPVPPDSIRSARLSAICAVP